MPVCKGGCRSRSNEYPRSREGTWPRAASDPDVESMLQQTIVMAEAQDRSSFRSSTVGEAAMDLGGVLLLVPSGLAAIRRRQEDLEL